MGPSRILYACDFGETAEAALEELDALANALGSSLVLQHVQQSLWRSWVTSGLVERQRRDRLESWRKKLSAPQAAEAMVRVTRDHDAARVIAGTAEVLQASLIVMGAPSDRRGLFGQRTLDRVIRLASQPVWVSKLRVQQRGGGLLCGIDLSAGSALALRFAVAIGTALGKSVTALHAVSMPSVNPLGLSDMEAASENDRHLAAAAEAARDFVRASTGSEMDVQTRWGLPAEVLSAAARDDAYGLVVVGPTEHSRIANTVRKKTADCVLRDSPCSVVVFGEAVARKRLERSELADLGLTGPVMLPDSR